MISIDLFAGAGGLTLGLKRAGIDCVWANEVESDFAATFKENNPESIVVNKDIHDIHFKEVLHRLNLEVGELDLLCGGPPCQGYSTIGNKNQRDPRNSLFYEFLRAVNDIRPKYVLFENVAGFRKLYKGEAFNKLTAELMLAGYSYDCLEIQVSRFGVPQSRKRTIVLATREDCFKVRLPLGYQTAVTLIDAIGDLPELSANDVKTSYELEPTTDYQRTIRDGCTVLTYHNSSNYGEKMKELMKLLPEGGDKSDLPEEIRPQKGFGNAYARLWANKVSPTITRNFGTPSSSRCIHPYQDRALSTREGARLQSFPDSYVFLGGKTSKNLQIGNAVPPLLAEAIGKEIVKSLDN